MFVALRKNGEFISLAEKWNRAELLHLRKNDTFTCPACKGNVLLKLGTQVSYHFAHEKGAECSVKTEPESEYHLQGKRQLLEWFQAQNYEVLLEPYLSEISQRPDLIVTTQNKRYAIEYQCSPIDYTLFKKRTDSYKRIGITPIWVLGARWFKRKSAHSISLNSFQWFFATTLHQSELFPSILYYCPDSKQFLKASNLAPFTSSETFCSITIPKQSAVSFQDLLNPFNPTYDFYSLWLAKKRRWRLSYSTYPSKNLSSFLLSLYNSKIPPAFLPGIAGIPIPSMYWFQTPTMVWQMWILLDVLIPLETGKTFFFSSIMQAIFYRIQSKEIIIRQLPLLTTTQYAKAIEEYLDVLIKRQIIKRINNTTYKKIQEIVIPKTMEEVYEQDEEFGNCCQE